MAFTEKTFSLLRESVKQSMQEDKKNGLITGDVVKLCVNNDTENDKPSVYILIQNLSAGRLFDLKTLSDDDRTVVRQMLELNDNRRLDNFTVKDGEIYVDVLDRVEVEEFAGRVIIEYKTVKKQTKFGRALRHIRPELSDKTIKTIVNEVKSRYANDLYVLFTSSHIQAHYRVLSAKQNLTSCMSKPAAFYGNVRPDTDEDAPSWERYIHPCEAYNDSPDLRLALVSRYHPDSAEFNKEGQYPFIARAIVNVKPDSEGEIMFPRVYGDECATRRLVNSNAFCCVSDALVGCRLHRIENDDGNYVMPYVDTGNIFNISDDENWYVVAEEGEGDYEVHHATGIVQEVERCYCEHCGRYHSNSEINDSIYVDHLNGCVYGDCRDEYEIPYGRDNYYYKHDYLIWSYYHDDYLHEDDAVQFISEITDMYDYVPDYIHEDDIGDDIVNLYEDYDWVAYADKRLCIETMQGHYYLDDLQDDYYEVAVVNARGDERYCDADEVTWSNYHDAYVPYELATHVESIDDYILDDCIEQFEQTQAEEVAHEAA